MTHALARWSRAEERLKRIEAAADELAKAVTDFDIALSKPHASAGSARVRMCDALAAYRKAQQET